MPKQKRPPRRTGLYWRLRKHLKTDPGKLAVVEQVFDAYERPNLHLALEEIIRHLHNRPEMMGVLGQHQYDHARLAMIARASTGKHYEAGSVEYTDVPLADGRQLACIKRALFLLRDSAGPLAILFEDDLRSGRLIVEVMAPEREQAVSFLRLLTRRVHHGEAFRGHMLSVVECYGQLSVQFHHLPTIQRESLILPEELLRRIERHTIGFSRHAEKLRQAGRHLKRGLLLHGPPGTGKTLSAMYLASQMPGRTVLLMTGGSVAALESACRLARTLTPATIILEDVDLIGTEREHQTIAANALLFELLNQMDGLADDCDLLFVLTTNRPDVLEPALAARPGRIDQAIEVPPPDAACRRRLLTLYGQGLKTEEVDWDRLVERTAGASGAFFRELLRKSLVFAAEDSDRDEPVIRQRHIDEALAELVIAGGSLTHSLLGANMSKKEREL